MCSAPSASSREPSFTPSVSIPSARSSTALLGLQRQERVAEVEQVEADDQQPVDRAGHARVVGEHLLQEDLAVLEQRAREPDGEADAGGDVDEIDGQ